MSLKTFDIWDQALLTDQISKPIDGALGEGTEGDLLGNRIAPLRTHNARNAKIRITEALPIGKGQIRAPDATPPLMTVGGETYREEIIELVLLDEMNRIQEEKWMALNSPDEDIARAAGVDIVSRGQQMRLRNERYTEWMRWQAFNGSLTLTYPTGQSLYVNYGLPSGHKPTAATLWSDATNCDPIADLTTWSTKLADDSGFQARYAHMTTPTYNYLLNSVKVKNAINFYAAGANSILRPRRQEIDNLLSSFSNVMEIVIYDEGFRDVGASGYGRSSLTRYLSDGKVLLTTDYVVGGTRIADVLDGQVTVSTGYNTVAIKSGFQSEVMLDHLSKTHFLRAASARVPRLLQPECFLWATVA